MYKIYFKKSLNVYFWILDKVSKRTYKRLYPKYLKWLGIDIDAADCGNTWISPTVFLDSSNYSLIEIGKNVTISFDVVILCHDYSISHAARIYGWESRPKGSLQKPVHIGDNTFIGARSVLLPGTTVGNNCIVGGGSVVKGILEDGSVYAGNPAKKIGTTESFWKKYVCDIY